jgi:hypothetical protein
MKTWTKAQIYALWLVQPIDAMDACFKRHDWAYQHPEEGITWWEADLILVEDLKEVNPQGWYANAFWWCSIRIFAIKGNLGKKAAQKA